VLYDGLTRRLTRRRLDTTPDTKYHTIAGPKASTRHKPRNLRISVRAGRAGRPRSGQDVDDSGMTGLETQQQYTTLLSGNCFQHSLLPLGSALQFRQDGDACGVCGVGARSVL
jgi:hypothetical protein